MTRLRSALVTIAITFQKLLDGKKESWTFEEELVIKALQRSKTSLRDADEQALAKYLASMNEEQRTGLAANVKGILHELLFEHAENCDGDEISARLFEATNHPGADIEFCVAGEVVSEIQLKATLSEHAVIQHLENYPNTPIAVTSETAIWFKNDERVSDSGFLNSDLTTEVETVFADLVKDGETSELNGLLEDSPLAMASITAASILVSNRVDKEQGLELLKTLGIAAATATAVETALLALS